MSAEGHLPGFDGATGWLNSPPLTAADVEREGRARRLLDVHLHQLAAHARLRPRVGREVPRSRVGHRRRAHARVPVRAGRRQRPPSRGGHGGRAIRSRSTATTGSGARSATTTGPPCTSPTRRDGSATTTSARAATTSARGSIQRLLREAGRDGIGDDLVSVDRRRLRGAGRLDEPARRPRPTSATSRAGTSRRPVVPRSTSRARTSRRTRCGSTSGRSPGTGRSRAAPAC